MEKKSPDYPHALECIHAVEDSFDVNSLTYRGIKTWPVIRHFLWRDLLSFNQSKNVQRPFSKVASAEIINHNAHQLEMDIKEIQYQTKDMFDSLEAGDILFLSQEKDRTETFDGKKFNKFADSFRLLKPDAVTFSALTYSHTKIDALTSNPYSEFLPANYLLSLSQLENSLEIFKKNMMNIPEEQIKNMDSFLELLQQKGICFSLTSQFLARYFHQLFILKNYCIHMLEKLQPKLVVVQYYCLLFESAMILAAKERNIPCADLQHGALGENDTVYFNWRNLAKNSYELFPNYILVWDEVTLNRIKQWASDTPLMALKFGNPLATFLKMHSAFLSRPPFIDTNKTFRILITLQPLTELLPLWLQKYMILKRDVQWIVRLHPSHPAMETYRNQANQILVYLEQNGVNVHAHEATQCNLYDLLDCVDFHITSHSTVAFEAMEFSVPTALFGTSGLGYMGEEVKKGIFKNIYNQEDLNTFLASPHIDFNNQKRHYSATADEIKQAFTTLLG